MEFASARVKQPAGNSLNFSDRTSGRSGKFGWMRAASPATAARSDVVIARQRGASIGFMRFGHWTSVACLTRFPARAGRMLPQIHDYEKLYREFRWAIPERYNIGVDVCDRWAIREPGRTAIVHVRAD